MQTLHKLKMHLIFKFVVYNNIRREASQKYTSSYQQNPYKFSKRG